MIPYIFGMIGGACVIACEARKAKGKMCKVACAYMVSYIATAMTIALLWRLIKIGEF